MGASFRNTGRVLALAGRPRLTISPALLEELAATNGNVKPKVNVSGQAGHTGTALTESGFRWGHNQDAMANNKLAEGIRRFAADQEHLEQLLADCLSGR